MGWRWWRNDDENKTFVRQFEGQRDGEVDDTWRANYADARDLLRHCERHKGDGGDEGMSLLMDSIFEEAIVRPRDAFTKQLNLLKAHWKPLQATLTDYEGQIKSTLKKSDKTFNILTKVVEDHYRGLLQLQVFQYWHRVLYDRAEALLSYDDKMRISSRYEMYRIETRDFRQPRLLGSEMRAIVERYATFLHNHNCDIAGISRGHHTQIVKQEEAEALLSRRRMDVPTPPIDIFLLGLYVGTATCFSIIIMYVILYATPIPSYDESIHFWPVVPLFRGYFVIEIALVCWALVMHVMDKRRINYPYLLGLTGETISSAHLMKISCFFVSFSVVIFAVYLLHVKCGVVVPLLGFENPLNYILFHTVVPAAVFLFPLDFFHRSSRWWLLKTVALVFATPAVAKVTFAANFVTDFMTSMVKPISDVVAAWYVVCSYETPSNYQLPTFAAELCVLLPLSIRFMQCVRKAVIDPYLYILKHRRKRKEDIEQPSPQRDLEKLCGTWDISGTSSTATIITENEKGIKKTLLKSHDEVGELLATEDSTAGGYSYRCELTGPSSPHPKQVELVKLDRYTLQATCTIPATGFQKTCLAKKRNGLARFILIPHGLNTLKYVCSLAPIFFSSIFENVYANLIFLIVSAAYFFFWDLFMDWGLWKRDTFPPRGLKPFAFGLVWRRTSVELTPANKLFYYFLVLLNLVGRCAWAFTLTQPKLLGITDKATTEMLVLCTSVIEVIRRCVWARMRLGHEQQVDIGQFRQGDGYRNVPPLISKQTPWTTPGEFAVLRKLKVDPGELQEFIADQENHERSKGWVALKDMMKSGSVQSSQKNKNK